MVYVNAGAELSAIDRWMGCCARCVVAFVLLAALPWLAKSPGKGRGLSGIEALRV